MNSVFQLNESYFMCFLKCLFVMELMTDGLKKSDMVVVGKNFDCILIVEC